MTCHSERSEESLRSIMVFDKIEWQMLCLNPGLITPSLTVHPPCPFPRKGSIPSPEGENHPGLLQAKPTEAAERTRIFVGATPGTRKRVPLLFGRRPITVT